MTVHQFNPQMLPDSDFQPGAFEFLVEGNQCRLLDGRRTPGHIEKVCRESGLFCWRITDFEDKGKCWYMPIENIKRYQMSMTAKKLPEHQTLALEKIAEKFSQPLFIPMNMEMRGATLAILEEKASEVKTWLSEQSGFIKNKKSFDFTSVNGSDELSNDLQRYMSSKGLAQQETLTSTGYVMNPHSGEWIKGLQIVFAEIGLKEFRGTIPRTLDIFSGAGERQLRREYILTRLAFVRAMLDALGYQEVSLFRGMSCEHDWRIDNSRFFSSWSFSKKVAESFCSLDKESRFKNSYLIKRTFSNKKIFMTYIETAAMNNQYKEAEAVILHDAEDGKLW